MEYVAVFASLTIPTNAANYSANFKPMIAPV